MLSPTGFEGVNLLERLSIPGHAIDHPITFAHGLIAETSVGLKAIAVLKDRCR